MKSSDKLLIKEAGIYSNGIVDINIIIDSKINDDETSYFQIFNLNQYATYQTVKSKNYICYIPSIFVLYFIYINIESTY